MSNQAIPLAHWKFDEESGTDIAIDSRGRFNATITGDAADFVPGVINNALSLPINTYASLNTTSLLAGKSQFSFTFWINFNLEDLNQGFLGNLESFQKKGWQVGVDISKIYFLCYNENEQAFLSTMDNLLDTGRWHHVAVVVDGKNVKFYHNSKLVFEENLAVEPTIRENTDKNIRIGTIANFFEPFSGSLDDLRIFDYAVIEKEIAFIFNGGKGTQDYIRRASAYPFGRSLSQQKQAGKVI